MLITNVIIIIINLYTPTHELTWTLDIFNLILYAKTKARFLIEFSCCLFNFLNKQSTGEEKVKLDEKSHKILVPWKISY